MDNNTKIEEYKKTKRKLETANLLIRFGLLAITFTVVLLIHFLNGDYTHPESYIPIFIVFIAIFFVLPFAMLPITIKVNNIIAKELDPWKLKYILENKSPFIQYTNDKYLAVALHTGNYQGVIDTCSDELKTRSKDKRFVLNYQSLAYFMLGDMTGLKIACSKFDDVSASLKGNSYLIYPNQRLLSLFADGKYNEIAELYEKEDYSGRLKSSVLNTEFIYAVAFYKLGQTQKAREIFQKIVDEAPLLNISKLSNDYLSAIENGVEYEAPIRITAENKPEKNVKKSKKLMKAHVFMRNLAVILSVLMILMLLIAQNAFDKDFENAARKIYEDCNLIEYYQIEHNGEVIETFALIEKDDSTVDLCYITETVDTGETNCHFYARDLKENALYITHGVLSDLDIMYKLALNKKDIPDTACQIFKFKHQGKTQYLYITEIKECSFKGVWGHN